MNAFSKFLLLIGSAALASGQSPDQPAANADLPPEKILMNATSEFAFDLYSKLADENEDSNLFFSPYSVSSALMLVAEGARGETALEIGSTLGFPEALLRFGEDAREVPWELSVVRTAQAELNRQINKQGEATPEQARLREEETRLLKKWEDLKTVIKKTENDEDATRHFQALEDEEILISQINDLRKKFDTLILRTANAVWGDPSSQFKEPWKVRLVKNYGVGLFQEADFIKDAEGERIRINRWVAKQTEGSIKDLFKRGSIDSETRLVLANAIYFKGDWMTPFDEEATREKPFNLSSGETVRVQLMEKLQDETAGYAAFNGDGSFFPTPDEIPWNAPKPKTDPGADGFSMVEMPYRGGKVSMIAIAPNDPKGLPALEKNLNATNLENWLGMLKTRPTNILLPRFKMEAGYDLAKTLKAMGMPTAFDQENADFSGLSEERLFINSVVHQANLEVTEKGTEAAAATGIGFAAGNIPQTVPFFPTFSADRPFIYLIRDQKSGAILFLGRMLNPVP